MKKHPVDDLFARKLNTWEPTPSDAVWQRIQAGQQKKERRLVGWYWYAAASIALVLVAGYMVWKGQSTTTSGMADGAITQVEVPVVPAPTPTRERLPETDKPQEAIVKKEQIPVYQPADAIAKSTIKKADEVRDNANSRRMDEPVLEVEIAKIAREEMPAATMDTPLADLQVPVNPSKGEPAQALQQKSEGRIVIAHVEVEEEQEEDQKSSRLFRVLRQLKNAKEGEAVNWNEVGVNPRKIMARADARIKNEEEKVSKQFNNFKEKIQL